MKKTIVAAALSLGIAGVAGAAPVVPPAAQLEIDRIVSRVDGRIITQSDIRQARALRLVDDTSSDDATRRALENRFLVLNELNRAAPLPPLSDEDLRARRAEWAATLTGGSAEDQLRQGGMGEADIQAWLRDDLRIRAYLRRQFGMLPGDERTRAIEEWITRLRQRADLSP